MCVDCGARCLRARFCSWCASPLRPKAPTDKARAVYAAAQERIIELMRVARKTSTIARNQAVWESISRFARDELDISPLHVAPLDVVCWLISADARARTVFHKAACPCYRAPEGGACDGALGCKPRLKHAAARTKTMQLRAWYRSAGHTTEWDPRTGTGNPCRSPEVDEYLAALLKEEIACGVHSDLAPLMAPGLVDALVRQHVLEFAREWHDTAGRAGDPLLAYWHLQCATVLAFLAHCPDRSYDVARINFQDVDFVPSAREKGAPRRHLRVRLGLNKTALHHGRARVVSIVDTDDRTVSPVTLFLRLKQMRDAPGVELTPLVGLIFLPKAALWNRKGEAVPHKGRVLVQPMSHKQLHSVLHSAQQLLGQEYSNLPLTPHSFRAAGAARALAEGRSVEEILHAFNWRSPAMLNHYVELRTLYRYNGPFAGEDDLADPDGGWEVDDDAL